METQVVIADDHKLVRKAISIVLSSQDGIRVVGEADDGRTVIQIVRELRPDVVVMNIQMPNLNGIEATRIILREIPNIKVVALSAHSDKQHVRSMLEVGARAYVSKQSEFEELVCAIEAVIGNKAYLSREIVSLVIEDYSDLSEYDSFLPRSLLSERQLEILQLIAEGKSIKVIASELHLSVKTIEWHRAQLMKRLGIKNTAGLVKYAIKKELTSVDF